MCEKKPTLLVFAGPNGSGKSTITQYFVKVGKYTNADDIVTTTGMSNLSAAKFVDKSRYNSIAKREDFTFETVLSSKQKIQLLSEAKAHGYFIKCVFVLTDSPSVNISRVNMRVNGGGHSVPKQKIVSRYYKALDNVKELLDLCDILHIYDNTDSATRIVRKHKEELNIFPNKYWSKERIIRLLGVDRNNFMDSY